MRKQLHIILRLVMFCCILLFVSQEVSAQITFSVKNQTIRLNPTKSLVDAYLCTDGKPAKTGLEYYKKTGVQTSSLYKSPEEHYVDYFQNRDPRMKMTLYAPGAVPTRLLVLVTIIPATRPCNIWSIVVYEGIKISFAFTVVIEPTRSRR